MATQNKTPVMIEIRDSHRVQGESYSSEILCDGMLEQLDDGWQLNYVEQSEGLQGSRSALRVHDQIVSLTREGEFPLDLTLEQGVRHKCYYNTPAGMMQLGVFARQVQSDLSRTGGQIKLNYTLDFSADMVSSNQLEINITTPRSETC
ncbi:MAG: DUF1934 domain-containing protein [Oscillospiraceae bacterium]|nr:DUF1934 domain-containing protein [Oscillospiraceae bacterium]